MSAGGSVARRGRVAESRVPPVVVVFVLPIGDDNSRVGQYPEDVDVEAFVADPAVVTRASSSRPEPAREDDSHFSHIQHGQTKAVENN